jgi:DNA helicase IV
MADDAQLSLYELVGKLIDNWSEWDELREFYLYELVPELKDDPKKGTTEEEKLIEKIKAIASPEEWENLDKIILRHINNERVSETLYEIKQALEKEAYKAADEIYCSICEWYEEAQYIELKQQYKNQHAQRKRHEAFRKELDAFLTAFRFSEADRLYERNKDLIAQDQYEKIKIDYVKRFVSQRLKEEVDTEQALAIAKVDKNLLVKARAGSGKTRVIACKTALLIDQGDLNPNHIMILAFNTKAAKEIATRIKKKYGFSDFQNARTFHSLAYQLVQPTKKLLFDDRGDLSTQKLSQFVQDTVRKIWNPVFRDMMYQTFRKELKEIEQSSLLLNDEDYCLYRRNLQQVTLGGERVKSSGEKFIADFLFEHGINYRYEPIWRWDGKNYRPDFSLYYKQKDLVIEHWGINEHDPKQSVPSHWTRTWQDYKAEMGRKRDFWRRRNIPLLETSINDLKNGRDYFEATLKERVEKVGITCNRLSEEEIQQNVERIQLSHMAQLFVQFIQKAKKKALSDNEVQRMVAEFHSEDERNTVFNDLACRVYLEYEKALVQADAIDFDDLLFEATNLIHRTEGRCSIRIDQHEVRMTDLQWLMIDEYQDFSKLFCDLVLAIRKYNPDLKLFCVGDDWQAINAFAGSDLAYFRDYTEIIDNSAITYLLTNYRSEPAIIVPDRKLHFVLTDS